MTNTNTQSDGKLETKQWVILGAMAAVLATIAVLIVRAIAIAVWPEVALFFPLGNPVQAIVLTTLGAIGATALFAWLTANKSDPVQKFLKISVIVLLISFIPDYILPDPYITFLASTVTAFLHVVAAVVILLVLLTGYKRQVMPQ